MRLTATICAAIAVSLSVPTTASDRIGTIDRGRYLCELPGDATGQVGIAQPDENFRIKSASRYLSDKGSGTYLLRGDEVIMTSGPKKGDRYLKLREGFLRKLDDAGNPTRLRCVRSIR